MKVTILLTLLALLFVANSWAPLTHDISGDASKSLSAGIKAEL